MDKPKIGFFHAIKNARANFQRLPAEAKTSYYLGGGLLIVLLALVINFVVPESEKKLQLPNQGASQSKRKGQNVADPDAVIPSTLAEEILDNRKQIQSQSQVVFNRYEETNSKLEKKKSQFLESLDVDLTPLNATEEVKEEVTSEDAIVKADEDVRPNEKQVVDKFLGEVNQPDLEDQGENDGSSSTSSYSVQALLSNPDIMQAWANSIVESDKRALNSSNVLERGRTVVFSDKDDNEKPINASLGGTEEQNADAETNEYMGDDFQPGRVFLARIDGFIESDTDTPFVRLKPVEGPKDWVDDAIFLAQPQLVEGKGYLINVKKVTYKNAEDIGRKITKLFDESQFDVCTIFYNKFKNVISQIPQEQQIIPIKNKENKKNKDSDIFYEFEPEENEILKDLLPRNISTQIFKAILENAASEQGSRMTAMDNATRNAGDLVEKLTINYNRSRQAAITKELIEIISGAESL